MHPVTHTANIAIIGNPNSGKTSVFNYLTGLRQKTGNFPGVTVDKKLGKCVLPNGSWVTIIDLPGAYSLHPTSGDERIVSSIMSNPLDPNYPDAVVYVADIMHLEKHLLLFTQLQDLGIPCLLALSMADIAAKEGLNYDLTLLSQKLGARVITISGRTGENMDLLKREIARMLERSEPFLEDRVSFFSLSAKEERVADSIMQIFPNYFTRKRKYRALLWAHHGQHFPFLEPDEKLAIRNIVEQEDIQSLSLQVNETMKRYDAFMPAVKALTVPGSGTMQNWTRRIDNIVMHKWFGPVIFFLIMLLIFQAIFAWSEYPMNGIETVFGYLSSQARAVFPSGWFTDLFIDGIIAGLSGIIVFVPQIALLFFLISLLEEVGYMARAVFMFDKIMQRFGLSGRSVVALISGGACAIPAVMSTRTIGNWKERLITIMVTPLISCSARIPVYTVLIGFVVPAVTVYGILNLQGLAFMGLYILGIVAALLSAWVFKKILKTEESSFLAIELPDYRPPIMRNVLLTMYEKVKTFTIEAGKVIIVISIILWALASYGPVADMARAEVNAIEKAETEQMDTQQTNDLIASKKLEASYAGKVGKFIEPAIEPLGFDWKIGIALLTSFAAREVFVGTMATIYAIGSEDDELTIRNHLAREVNHKTGKPVYTMATSLSLLIFYVFAMQCMSTLAVVKRETKSWKWPTIQFLYMSALAYIGSLIVYQIFA